MEKRDSVFICTILVYALYIHVVYIYVYTKTKYMAIITCSKRRNWQEFLVVKVVWDVFKKNIFNNTDSNFGEIFIH